MSYSDKPNSQYKNRSKKKIDFNHDHPAKKKKILTVVNEETGEIEARVNLTNHMYSSGNWFAFFIIKNNISRGITFTFNRDFIFVHFGIKN